jgi:DNA N-6-adenine-methyltransferase (Dam)
MSQLSQQDLFAVDEASVSPKRRGKAVNNASLINQDSGDVEYYTPEFVVEAVRQVMGCIDLDPASCAEANKTVKAVEYYTLEADGLTKSWYGHVFMNHPFSRMGNKPWIAKLVNEYKYGNVVQACCICYASTSEGWFQPLFDYPICFLSPRTDYYDKDGKKKNGVTKGSVVAYLGRSPGKFYRVFRSLGRVMLPASIYLPSI